MDRREFIRNVIASAATSGLVAVPLVPALGTRPAQAQYVEAVVAAIGVIKMIADTSRGDGGLGASLSAINGKLDVAIQQLAALQKSIEFIIGQIAQLRKDIFDALGQQAAYVIHNEVVTAIQRIKDIILEAQVRGVSLQANNPARGDFVPRLEKAYDYFDIARDKLVNLPEGRSTLPSSVCSACLAVDCAALGWGIITDVNLAISVNHHIDWLTAMADPKQQHSVAEAINTARDNESRIVEAARTKFEKDRNAASFIAYKLHSASPADLCVVYRIDAESYGQDGRDWLRTGETKSVLAARFTRDEVDKSGALFLKNIKDVDHIVAHLKPDGTPWSVSRNIGEIDQAKCVQVNLESYKLDYTRVLRMAQSAKADVRDWKVIGPILFQDVRTTKGILWKDLTSPKTWQEAQLILDQVNVERLNQAYAAACLSFVLEHRAQALRIQQNLPKVSESDRRPR